MASPTLSGHLGIKGLGAGQGGAGGASRDPGLEGGLIGQELREKGIGRAADQVGGRVGLTTEPGALGQRLADAGIGEQRVTLIGFPDVPAPAVLQDLGVARLSYGPLTQRVALGALVDFAEQVYGGAALPEGIRPLN